MIEVRSLTKKYGGKVAVEDLSFTVRPRGVTGFLGPNGAGKSTTMRMILGLDRPTSGSALVNGHPYDRSRRPLNEIGVLLDAKNVHGGRTAHAHLLALAQSNGIQRKRVDEVLEMVGLTSAAGKRIRGFSLGMAQRLGLAAAMLGDPQILMLDEPINGLDPEGVLWVRNSMRTLAAEGRTVFISSHLMSEMALTADHLIIIGRGRLLADMSTKAFIEQSSHNYVHVRTPQATKLAELLTSRGLTVEPVDGHLQVTGAETAAIADLAYDSDIRVHEIFLQRSSLEEAYMEMTQDSVEYHAEVATPTATEGKQ